jgi:predicted HAD superfamily Cof-like phosphohydrolase
MTNWVKDIHDMHAFYGMHEKFAEFDDEKKKLFLTFRANFIQEELNELHESISDSNPEEIVDALIDICVVAIGTLDAFNIDSQKAWDEVLRANMSKKVGVKPGRPNPIGLPDLMKPEGWQAPDHSGNHGNLPK